jgi:hypothetical protein
MSEPGDATGYAPGEAGRRTLLCWLPLAVGAVVLSLCWIAMAVLLTLNGGTTCFMGGMGLGSVGNALAHDLGFWDDSGLGAAIALLIYAAVSLAPFLMLSGCVRLAARGRTTLFLVVLAGVGTAFVSLYDVLGFSAAYADLAQGGFLCGLAFELVPIGGVIAGACAVVVGSLAALAAERFRRARR